MLQHVAGSPVADHVVAICCDLSHVVVYNMLRLMTYCDNKSITFFNRLLQHIAATVTNFLSLHSITCEKCAFSCSNKSLNFYDQMSNVLRTATLMLYATIC